MLRYIDNDVLCHNSAGSFQGLLEAKKEIVDSMLIADLLELYQNKQFTKQVIF